MPAWSKIEARARHCQISRVMTLYDREWHKEMRFASSQQRMERETYSLNDFMLARCEARHVVSRLGALSLSLSLLLHARQTNGNYRKKVLRMTDTSTPAKLATYLPTRLPIHPSDRRQKYHTLPIVVSDAADPRRRSIHASMMQPPVIA